MTVENLISCVKILVLHFMAGSKGWQRDGRRLSIKLSVKLPKKRSFQ